LFGASGNAARRSPFFRGTMPGTYIVIDYQIATSTYCRKFASCWLGTVTWTDPIPPSDRATVREGASSALSLWQGQIIFTYFLFARLRSYLYLSQNSIETLPLLWRKLP
jgi:hypothetical protein